MSAKPKPDTPGADVPPGRSPRARWRRTSPDLTGRGALSLLRRGRAHRHGGQHRPGQRCSRRRATGEAAADYLNCPFDKAGYEAFYAALADGGTRARCTTLTGEQRPCTRAACRSRSWQSAAPDTMRYGPLRAGGAARPAHRPPPLGGRAAAAARTAAGTLLQSGGLPDKPQIRRAEAGLFDDPRAGARGVRALRRDAPQQLSQRARRLLGTDAVAEKLAPTLFCRADHRGGGLYGERGLRPAGRPIRCCAGCGACRRWCCRPRLCAAP